MSTLRKLYLNWIQLAGSSGTILLCSFASGVITARALDVATLGLLTIVQGIVRFFDGTVAVKTYDTLIKLGTNAASADQRSEFVGLVKVSFLIEFLSQLIACTCALVVIYFVGQALGLTEDSTRWGLICALGGLLSNSSGLAVLRIFGKFVRISMLEVSTAIVRLVATITCAYFQVHPFFFLLAWLAVDTSANAAMILLARNQLRRAGYPSLSGKNLPGITSKHKEFWQTIFSAKVALTLRMATEQGDVLLVGSILGPVAAGYLRIAKTISFAVMQLAWPINHLMGPTLTNYWATRNVSGLLHIFKMTIPITLVIFVAAVLPFYLWGTWLIGFFYGLDYAPAAGITTIYVFANALIIVGFAIMPTIYAMGRSIHYMYIHIACVVAFVITVYLLLPHLGLLATGIGHVVYQSLWLVIGYGIIFQAIYKMPRPPVPASAE